MFKKNDVQAGIDHRQPVLDAVNALQSNRQEKIGFLLAIAGAEALGGSVIDRLHFKTVATRIINGL